MFKMTYHRIIILKVNTFSCKITHSDCLIDMRSYNHTFQYNLFKKILKQ